jgi:hypothetical protein
MSYENEIEYAFREDELIEEMMDYINSTYDAHYSQNQYQSTEIIEDMGHGMGFALGNVIKYCQRYGKKAGHNRDDLKKVIHYGIIALAMHDNEHEECITTAPIDSLFLELDSDLGRLHQINLNVEEMLKPYQADQQTDNVVRGSFGDVPPGQEPGQD